MALGKDLGRIWEGFWEDFGRILGGFWKDFGRILGGFWEDFGKDFVEHKGKMWDKL